MNNGDRWILVGDSLQCGIYEAPGPVAQPCDDLMAVLLAQQSGCVIHNLSAPGARAADGGTPGLGWISHWNTIQRVSSMNPAKGLILMLGTNDWYEPTVSGAAFVGAYRGLVRAAISSGLLVVGVTPLWRSIGASRPVKADGAWNLVEWGSFVSNVCSEEGAKFISGYSAPLLPEDFPDGTHLGRTGHIKLTPWLKAKMVGFSYMA